MLMMMVLMIPPLMRVLLVNGVNSRSINKINNNLYTLFYRNRKCYNNYSEYGNNIMDTNNERIIFCKPS